MHVASRAVTRAVGRALVGLLVTGQLAGLSAGLSAGPFREAVGSKAIGGVLGRATSRRCFLVWVKGTDSCVSACIP